MLTYANMPVTGTLKLEIESCAFQLEFELAKYLLPPPRGVYIKNMLEPAMVDGHHYFVKEGKNHRTVTDINTVDTDLYTITSTDNYKLVIPEAFLRNKDQYLSNYPIIPYRGSKIIQLLLSNHLHNSLKYHPSNHHYESKLKQHLIDIDEESLDDVVDKISITCDSLIIELTNFIDKDDWFVYASPSLNNKYIEVKKYVDYRVIEYYRLTKPNLDEENHH